MCYHKSLTKTIDYLSDYYSASYGDVMKEVYAEHYHENGYDFLPGPIVTAAKPGEIQPYNWGLIPWWCKTEQEGLEGRVRTLNCRSEAMFETDSYRDAAKNGQRCLIPCSGFIEWRHFGKGKNGVKIPHYIKIKGQEIFSIAGLYSDWKDRSSDREYHSYTVLTTRANSVMEKIHNSKKRQPVLLSREFEKDWLNPNLSKEDVLALCEPSDSDKIEYVTINKIVGNSKINSDIPEALQPTQYPETSDLFS
jgi:putative SOS response-associated peptidase YedK